MFRRPGKNSTEENSLFKEDATSVSSYPYGHKKNEASDVLPRVFDQSPGKISGYQPEDEWKQEKTTPLPHPFHGMLKEDVPETTLGEGVTFRGELSFERLLRIDGTFEGELLSQGKVIVGSKGKVKANLNLREAIIEGEVYGNITVQEKLELRGTATIHGDIKAKSLCIDEGVTLVGHVTVAQETLD